MPSLGFVVWDRRRKLKPEYQDLSGEQIRDLRLAGTEVSAEVRRPIVAYLGDSAPAGLDDNPAMYEAKILICELTFVAPDHRKDKIHKFGHMHLDDIVERRDRFKNELVIAAHLSTRYHAKSRADARRARRSPTCSTAGCTCGCNERKLLAGDAKDLSGWSLPRQIKLNRSQHSSHFFWCTQALTALAARIELLKGFSCPSSARRPKLDP